jgi:hypothetical protein
MSQYKPLILKGNDRSNGSQNSPGTAYCSQNEAYCSHHKPLFLKTSAIPAKVAIVGSTLRLVDTNYHSKPQENDSPLP